MDSWTGRTVMRAAIVGGEEMGCSMLSSFALKPWLYAVVIIMFGLLQYRELVKYSRETSEINQRPMKGIISTYRY